MKEKDEEIRAVRSQLAEARLALESVAEGADMATNEASEQLREADGRRFDTIIFCGSLCVLT